jgi:diguanylate cyclase (GGDEF)-like protein
VRKADDPGAGHHVTALDLRDRSTPALTVATGELLALTRVVRSSCDGVRTVYRLLDQVAQLLGLDDLVVVVTDTPVGRQVFRRARHAADDTRFARILAVGAAGLHGPDGVHIDPDVAEYVTDLCAVALRLELLRHDASTDPLTGLLNRRSYEVALADAISRTRRYGWPFALVMIDLDHFKAVNDRHGHAAGDEALRSIGHEIRAVLRQGDVAARLGGDEFALLVANVKSPADVAPLVDRLRQTFARAMPAPGLGFSVGVACYPQDAPDAEGLAALADARMYAGKSIA